jgi:hypothetical protein
MSWPVQKFVWEGIIKKTGEIVFGLCSRRESNRALASLERRSETMKQVKDIHQDSNWLPPE